MAPIHSAQEFVRALKSPSDPPSPGRPLKVEIANQTWKDASFHVPRKAEVIVEWILGKLLKEKSKELSSNPILDLRLWHLLHEVISTDVALLSPHTRPSKTWLANLLHRTPVTPIFVAFLDVLGDLDPQIRKALSQIVYSCLLIIWPLAVQRVGTETLLDCFGAFLPVVQWCENDEGLVQIGIVVISSYKESLYNSPNKKKIHNTFLHALLHRWLESAVLEISPVTRALLELIYNAGAETLFNLETLRHAHDTKSENFFDAIKAISNSNAQVLSCLPRLFASYVHSIQKHRSALFIQGSNQQLGAATEELRASAMSFFAASDSLLDAVESNAQIWSIKVALLHLVNHEGLYNRNQAQASVLHRIVESARKTLGKEGETGLATCVVEGLSALARIDYDLISSALSDILPKLSLARSSQTFITFLDLLLDYYSKTRTMNTFLGHLLSALSPRHIQGVAQPMWDVYNISNSGPLLDAKFLAHLSKAVQTFLPGAQIESAIAILLQYLEEALGEFDKVSGHDHGDRHKRRRIEVTATSVHSDASAISFSLSARVASVVVSSFAMESIAPATRGEVGQKLSDLRNSFIHRKLTKAFKIIRNRAGSNVWSSQIVATSSLRLVYALEISHPTFLQPSGCSKLWKNVSDSLEDNELLPELTVEMFRVLLSQPLSQDETQFRALFDQILVNMDRHFSASVSWSGQLHHLIPENQGRAKGLLALLHMVIQKWLPLIEFLASRPQIERLIRLMISVDVTDLAELSVVIELCTQSLVGITFHSANFWEFHRIRVVFLGCLSEATAGLNEDAGLASDSQLTGAIAAYRLLLLLPVEYMPRLARVNFIKRALAADRFFSNLSVDSDRVSNYVDQSLIILRAFLKRVLAHVDHIEQPAEQSYEYLKRLMAQGLRAQASVTYVSVTIDVIEVHLHELFKVSGPICTEAVQMIIGSFAQSDWHSSSSRTYDVGYQSTIRMLEFLVTDFSLSNFSHELQGSLRELHKSLLKLTLPLVSSVHTSTDIVDQCNMLKLWCSLLSFGRWLGVIDMPSSLETIHLEIVRMSMSTQSPASHDRDSIRVASFAILLQELHYRQGNSLSHLEAVIASYTIHSRVIGVADRQQMDDHFSKACGSLSPSDFAYALDCIYESLANNPTSAHGLAPLIQLSMILLHDHPPNTLKPMQQFATRCIVIFADHSLYTDGPLPLRVQALDFVARQCSDRSAALQMVDMGSIWTLLSRSLSASRIHDDETTVDIFHKSVAIVSALVRLRRDLLTPNLPHLATILQQLMLSMRRVRPHIGAKQITLVTDTQPRYINAKNPLGMEEAKLLARLLEMLASKTTVRTNYMARSQDARKAESLSKPFSKHAPYVLKAYIESMNDPLCIIPSSLRKELQSGLYALCGMMKDHSRDAMMVSALDAGGKTTMKALWKEYEKQRYIGKG